MCTLLPTPFNQFMMTPECVSVIVYIIWHKLNVRDPFTDGMSQCRGPTKTYIPDCRWADDSNSLRHSLRQFDNITWIRNATSPCIDDSNDVCNDCRWVRRVERTECWIFQCPRHAAGSCWTKGDSHTHHWSWIVLRSSRYPRVQTHDGCDGLGMLALCLEPSPDLVLWIWIIWDNTPLFLLHGAVCIEASFF